MREMGRIGRMGEFLAALLFEEHGVETMHVDRDGADLIVRLPSGDLRSVDVKASTQPSDDGTNRRPPRLRYQFNVRGKRPDFYALVALDTRLMVVLPAAKIGASKTIKKYRSAFTPEAMAESIRGMAA